MTQEALKLALEALECALSDHRPYIVQCKEAITAIKEALAQEQEPVANYCKECLTYNGHHEGCSHYTTPPQRTWQGLTNEDISEVVRGTHNTGSFVRAIEAKLREKNSQHKEKNT